MKPQLRVKGVNTKLVQTIIQEFRMGVEDAPIIGVENNRFVAFVLPQNRGEIRVCV
jgi:hypothetical protein